MTIQPRHKSHRGNRELERHLAGGKLSLRQAVSAKCADCMNWFADGAQDCRMPACPLYPWQPYHLSRLAREASDAPQGPCSPSAGSRGPGMVEPMAGVGTSP